MVEISVAEDVLAAQPHGVSELPGTLERWLGLVLFLVTPGSSPGVDALNRIGRSAQAAAERFPLVTPLGVELAGAFAGPDEALPDEVIAPRLFEGGIVVGASSLDGVEPAQACTMLRVLLGELHSRQVGAHVSCPPENVDARSLPVWQDEGAAAPADSAPVQDAPVRWFVHRRVRAVTTTGVAYVDYDWLRPDRTWSRDRAGALSLDNTPGSRQEAGALVVRLREELGEAPEVGDTNAVLLRPDQGDPLPMPPDTIRDHGHEWRMPCQV